MERVYLELKTRAMCGIFAPGERLDPSHIARELGVSPTPVRDALYRLSGERLIDSWHHEGFRQRILLETEVQDLYAWSAVLLGVALQGRSLSSNVLDEMSGESAANNYPDQVSRLFRSISTLSSNRELHHCITNLVERCHVFRSAEMQIDPKCGGAVMAMAEDFRSADWNALRSKIKGFHRRRTRLAGRVVAEIRPRE
jgi:DNA-binding GntR family transcriptional regulator